MANRLHLLPDPAGESHSELLTFLVADVRGYTRFTQRRGDEAAAALARKFAAVARDEIEPLDGTVLELRGDEALAIFHSVRQALRAAVNLVDRFARDRSTDPDLPIDVGVGLDAGEAIAVEGGYRGGALNLASRLCNAAGPGQILASHTVAHLARRIKGLRYVDREPMLLKGFDEPVEVVQVITDVPDTDAASQPPPSREAIGARGQVQRLPRGGFLGSLPEGHLVGRSSEMQILSRLLAELEQGGRLVMLAGEPGVGKTRLAQEVSAQAHRRGYTLASGICYEQQQIVPYHPFRQVLSTLLALCPPDTLSRAGERWSHLRRLLPELGSLPPSPQGPGEEQTALFWTVDDLVKTVSQDRPVVLALDDLQWADDSSLALLAHLARQTRALPVLILATYRRDEIDRDHPLARTLLDLHRQRLLEQVTLQPFQREETLAMIEALLGPSELPPTLIDLIYQRSEGNAFFVQEIVRTLLDRGNLQREGTTWAAHDLQHVAVPEQVRALIEQRLEHLGNTTRQALTDAAILGQVFSFSDLQSLTRRGEGELDAAVDEGLEAGLIREAGNERYAFSHGLIHQAIIESLPPRRARRLHAAAGTMIEEATEASGGVEARAAELAWHFTQADDPDRALRYAVLAADQAVRTFSLAEAERLYRMALEIAWETDASAPDASAPDASAPNDPRPRTALAAHAHEWLGGVLQTVGRSSEALDMQERAAQLYEVLGDVEGQRRVVAAIGSIHADQGTIEEGMARLQPLIEAAARVRADDLSEGLALLLVTRANLRLAAQSAKHGLEDAERAAAIARRLQSQTVLARVEVGRARALSLLGRQEEARAALEVIVPRIGPDDQATLSLVLDALGSTQLSAGDLPPARRYLEQSLEIAGRVGDRRGQARTFLSLSRVLFMQGDWKGSYDLLLRALALVNETDMASLHRVLRISQAYLLAIHGEAEMAETMLQEELLAAQARGDTRGIALAEACLAEHELLRGNGETARCRLEALLPSLPATPGELVDPLRVLARARLATGDVAGAEALINQAVGTVGAARNRITFADVLAIRGMIRAAQRRQPEAARLFEGAFALLRNATFPLLEGQILLAWGQMEAQDGAVEQGHRRIAAARDLFGGCEALAYVAIAEAALQSLNPTP